MKNEKSTAPAENKKPSADEVLNPKVEATVKYGGKDYKITRLKLKQLLAIIRLVSVQSEEIRKGLIEARKKKGATSQLEDVMIILETLEEESVYELIGTILDEKTDAVEAGFSIADAIGVIVEALKLEDIEKIFFQVGQLKDFAVTQAKKVREKNQ